MELFLIGSCTTKQIIYFSFMIMERPGGLVFSINKMSLVHLQPGTFLPMFPVWFFIVCHQTQATNVLLYTIFSLLRN